MISILIPTYNTAGYIERCLTSASSQDYPDYEIVVVDDGSTDGTVKKVEALAVKDSRIRLFPEAHGGAAAARNRLLGLARGEYVFFLDSDDWISPDALSLCADAITAGHVVRSARLDWTPGAVSRVYSADEYLAAIIPDRLKSYIAGTLFRREDFRDPFPDGTLIEDYAYYPALAERMAPVAVIASKAYHYTVNRPGSTTARTAIKPAGVQARLVCAERRFDEYCARFPYPCRLLLGEIADYAVTAAMSRDAGAREDGLSVLRRKKDAIAENPTVPAFRKLEARALLRVPQSAVAFRAVHAVKRGVIGVRKADRRLGGKEEA